MKIRLSFVCWSLMVGCGHVGIDLGADENALGGRDASVSDDDSLATDHEPEAPGDASVDDDVDDTDQKDGDGGDEPNDASVDDPDDPTHDAGKEPGDVEPDDVEPDVQPYDAGPDAGDTPLRDGGEGLDGSISNDAGDEPNPDENDAGTRPDGGATGDNRCAPECACPEGEVCGLRCDTSECSSTCSPGSTCNVVAGEAEQVDINCGEGATCEASGPLGDSVDFTCEGPGDCTAACGDAAICQLDCFGPGTCTLDCGNAVDCSVDCAEGSRCFMKHGNASTDTEFGCTEANRRECSVGLLACNADCPAAN